MLIESLQHILQFCVSRTYQGSIEWYGSGYNIQTHSFQCTFDVLCYFP